MGSDTSLLTPPEGPERREAGNPKGGMEEPGTGEESDVGEDGGPL